MIYIRGWVCLMCLTRAIDKWRHAFGQGKAAVYVNRHAAWF